MEEQTNIQDPVEVLQNLLLEGRTEDVLLQLKSNNELLQDRVLDLIPKVYDVLRKKNENQDITQCCKQILLSLAELGNPKEVLMGLLEQISASVDDEIYVLCLKPIQKVLLRLPSKRGQSMIWVFNILHQHVKRLNLPKDYKLENEEKLLLDMDENVQRLQCVIRELICFYSPFVQEVSHSNLEKVIYKDRFQFQRFILLHFLLQLLEYPLSYLDLTHTPDKPKSCLRDCSEKIVEYIKNLESNFYNLFELCSDSPVKSSSGETLVEGSKDEINFVSKLSVATFFYLVFSEGIGAEHVPCVYTKIYTFESCLPFIILLLKQSETCATEKGLKLADALMHRLQNMVFTITSLDFGFHLEFIKSLIHVMLFCGAQSLRQISVKIFRNFMEKFEFHARFQLLKSNLSFVTHAGVRGLIIQIYKDNLSRTLELQPVPPWFIGSNLSDILRIIVPLSEGASSDILEKSDCILSVLNLIRYLAIRDNPQTNQIGFWNSANVHLIEEALLSPLQMALNLSRSHYKLELKHQEENKNVDSSLVDLSVNGCPLLSMPKEQKLQILKLALNNFDMIQSVMARVSDLISEGKKITQTIARICKIRPASTAASQEKQDFTSQFIEDKQSFDDETDKEVEIRKQILSASLPFVSEYGWSKKTLVAGAESLGLPDVVHGLFTREGVDLVFFFYDDCHSKLVAHLEQEALAVKQDPSRKKDLSVFIQDACETRLRYLLPYKNYWPQALSLLVLPTNAPEATSKVMQLVDTIWFYAGDKSVNFNWYTKRMSLAAAYKATELCLIQDESPDCEATWKFLDRRINNLKFISEIARELKGGGEKSWNAFQVATLTIRNILGLGSTDR